MSKPDPRLQYEQWVSAYAPELYRFAYRLSGKHQIAEDLTQETFVEAWKSAANQREPGKERAWLYQILRHRYSHHLRDRRQEPQMAVLQEDMAAARRAIPALETLAEKESLNVALALLSPEIRETFLMVFMQGYKCREAAADLNVPLGTVLSRISRARESLRKTLQQARETENHGGRQHT